MKPFHVFFPFLLRMKNLFLACFLACTALTVCAQIPKNPNLTDANGKRQGKWTIYFNEEWDEVKETYPYIRFYRLLTYQDDKPVGKVTDYFKNGTLQFEGTMSADRPKEIREGVVTYYDEKGRKTRSETCQNNKTLSTLYFDSQGNETLNNWEVITLKADELYGDKKYKEALPLYEQAKTRAEDEYGKEGSAYATTCSNLGFVYDAVKMYEKAEISFVEAQKAYEKLVGKETLKYASACTSLASIYKYNLNNPAKALQLYEEAQNIYAKLVGKENTRFVNAFAEVLDSKEKEGKTASIIASYEEIVQLQPKVGQGEYRSYVHHLYILAKHYRSVGKHEQAEKLYNEVLTTNAKILAKTNPAKVAPPIRIAKNIPHGIKKQNLGANVNTKYADITPFVTADGKTLYYVSKYNPNNTGGEKDTDEIYISEMQADGTWGKAQNAGKPLNNAGGNAVISVTPDNNSALLLGTYKADGSSAGGGISITERTENGWSIPKETVIINDQNKAKFVTYNLSADGKTLLMSKQRDETIGEMDIYVSFLQEDEKWSEPKNLGKTINTWRYEGSPFIAPDGVTLYFASNGHVGYGNTDIFVARRLDDTWQNWTEPENLGAEINTNGEESFFVIPASGKSAYMCSAEESLGSMDIVKLDLPASVRPQPVVMISGKVLNAKTKQPIGADITYRDLETDKELGIARSAPKDGFYKIILPAGKVYSFLAEKEKFIATSNNLSTKNLQVYKEIQQDLYLTPIEVGQTIRLNNIFFDTEKFALRNESTAELNRLVRILNENPDMAIEVTGHTDAVGNDQNNMTLSQNRANAVKDYLLSKGIASNRLSSKGFGKTKPLASNDTEEGKQMNRRVEFSIVK
ncbi:MAG: hypothetical protein EAZ95_06915 [Bacteroidetes bacterium]|nr:MAG: hypothetical protein EAZ95_06915 [Bacteroidota bacterium]